MCPRVFACWKIKDHQKFTAPEYTSFLLCQWPISSDVSVGTELQPTLKLRESVTVFKHLVSREDNGTKDLHCPWTWSKKIKVGECRANYLISEISTFLKGWSWRFTRNFGPHGVRIYDNKKHGSKQWLRKIDVTTEDQQELRKKTWGTSRYYCKIPRHAIIWL